MSASNSDSSSGGGLTWGEAIFGGIAAVGVTALGVVAAPEAAVGLAIYAAAGELFGQAQSASGTAEVLVFSAVAIVAIYFAYKAL
jgi:hypothetical protein